MSRAAFTRALTSAEDSAFSRRRMASNSTLGTLTCKSMRSSIGPEIFSTYFSTCCLVQWQRPEGWPYQPQRQGFIAPTSMKRLGSVILPAARVMVTSPSSMGARSTSSTSRWNSGSSSKKSTPWCASEISPGLGVCPPPVIAEAESVWCGARNGRCSSIGCELSVNPATDQISVASSASFRVMSGRIDGSRRASMDLPAPGEPMSRILCPPAAAISSARLTFSCPMTSEKSGPVSLVCSACHFGWGESFFSPFKCCTSDTTSGTP